MWTVLDGKPPLKDSSGLKCCRFLLCQQVITVREMALNESEKGLNSEIYTIDIDDDEQPVILKKFCPSDDSNVEPEIEAELQRWAYYHGLAPDVKASNSHAMITEKCQKYLLPGVLTEGSEYRFNSKLSSKRFGVGNLNEALGAGSLSIYTFVQLMFDTCGLYNKDPNMGNYMILRNQLKQIDFGKNRFASEAKFNEFFEQLPKHLKRSGLRDVLLDIDSTFPPLYHWYSVFVVDASHEKKQTWDRATWSTCIPALKGRRQMLLNQLAAEKAVIGGSSTKVVAPIVQLIF